ncbi:hypothetical protein [Bifidobacterium xylocopae]|nr:hypothetical protein [Bifidobacterium xylocopae]
MPGPNSMRFLIAHGLLEPLDPSCSYLHERAGGIFGRASIVTPLLPYGAAASNGLAHWVWTGGAFPPYIDIISSSHFRTPVHGHIIRVHNRRLPTEHMMKLGDLWTTSPLRTACDLACEPPGRTGEDGKLAGLHTLMERYQVSCGACLNLLADNPRWPGHSLGIEAFQTLRRIL